MRLRKGDDNVLELLPWQQWFAIYLKCLLLNVLFLVKNALKSIKCYLDRRYGPSRQYYVNKLKILNFNTGNSDNIKVDQLQHLASPPQLLMDTQLGKHSYIKLQTSKIHYLECGITNDRVALLLHGFPDCWLGWRHQLPELSKSYRCLVVDLKGFNDSDKPQMRYKYTPNYICQELMQLLEALNIKTVTLLGHDLGGLIGWIFTLKYPDVVNKFVSISASHPNLYWSQSKKALLNQSWCNFVQFPFLPEIELNDTSESFIRKFYGHLETVVNYEGDNNAQVLEAYRYIFSGCSDWTGPLNYYRNFMFYRVKSNLTVRCPTLIISGNEDHQTKLETIIQSAEFCDNSLIKIIEGAGHFPHQSNVKEFNQILMKYLVGERTAINGNQRQSPQRGLVGRMFNKVVGSGPIVAVRS
ncbi:unnamed protein product [Diamesa hyperborea]